LIYDPFQTLEKHSSRKKAAQGQFLSDFCIVTYCLLCLFPFSMHLDDRSTKPARSIVFWIMVLTTNVATLLQCFNSCRYWEVLNLIDIWHWQCVHDIEDASLRFVSQLLPYPWYFATNKLYTRFMDKRSTTCEISHGILLFSSLNTLMLYKLHCKRVYKTIVNWNNSLLICHFK
jgi:hypothetical protein